MHAIIYTKDHCPYCTRAKALFDKRGITYEEKIIAVNGKDARELRENQSWTTRDALLEAAPAANMVGRCAYWRSRRPRETSGLIHALYSTKRSASFGSCRSWCD